MTIRQLSVTFQPEQDRILLRVATADAQELQLWLTRRLLRGLWPLLARSRDGQDAADAAPPGSQAQAQPAPQGRRWEADTQRDEFLAEADFSTPFRESADRPLGVQPLLATEVALTPLGGGRLRLGFAQREGDEPVVRTLEMTLEPALVQGLAHLLALALSQSQWQLPFDAALQAMPAPDEARPRYLN